MGTTYQAQVEVFIDAREYLPGSFTRASFQPISRWELQKDYQFSAAWSQVAASGWPSDVIPIGEHEPPDPQWGYDLDQKYYGIGEVLASLMVKEPWPWFLELQAHVKRLLEQGYEVRILTWGE